MVGEPQYNSQLARRPFWIILTRTGVEIVGGKASPGDRSIVRTLECLDHEYNSLHRAAFCAGHVAR
jgi:hypothetical protein